MRLKSQRLAWRLARNGGGCRPGIAARKCGVIGEEKLQKKEKWRPAAIERNGGESGDSRKSMAQCGVMAARREALGGGGCGGWPAMWPVAVGSSIGWRQWPGGLGLKYRIRDVLAAADSRPYMHYYSVLSSGYLAWRL